MECRVKPGERVVVGLRREPFDRQIEIAIERAFDRIVERQFDSDSGRWGSDGRPRLLVRLRSASRPGFSKLLCGFAGDLIHASRL